MHRFDMTTGRVHSIQTFGTVDGPGIRYVLFLQGCLLRCKFCHNRDLWSEGDDSQLMDVEEIIEDILKYKAYYDSSGGGVTVTGGEPLMQMAFVTELFRRCKEEGIHTVIDTAALVKPDDKFDELLKVTDLFLLDIKQVDKAKHKELTGVKNKKVLKTARYLSEKGVNTWIRHVVVPGYTFDKESATEVAEFVSTLNNVEKVELLPFHQMGAHKWDALGKDYALKDIKGLTMEDIQPIRTIFESYKLPV